MWQNRRRAAGGLGRERRSRADRGQAEQGKTEGGGANWDRSRRGELTELEEGGEQRTQKNGRDAHQERRQLDDMTGRRPRQAPGQDGRQGPGESAGAARAGPDHDRRQARILGSGPGASRSRCARRKTHAAESTAHIVKLHKKRRTKLCKHTKVGITA